MPELNVRENTAFPFLMKNFNKEEAFARAEKILADVGLKERARGAHGGAELLGRAHQGAGHGMDERLPCQFAAMGPDLDPLPCIGRQTAVLLAPML